MDSLVILILVILCGAYGVGLSYFGGHSSIHLLVPIIAAVAGTGWLIGKTKP